MRVKKFHVHCIKWCTMHVVNLGLLHALNGGAMSLYFYGQPFHQLELHKPSGSNQVRVQKAPWPTRQLTYPERIRKKMFDIYGISTSALFVFINDLLRFPDVVSCNHRLRMMLAQQLLRWGPGSLQDQLDCAYSDFTAWRRSHKISSSQPPFTVKSVPLRC